jgi:hypothetical protein
MKAKEAPEKIYLPIDDSLKTYARKDSDEEIEYARTDDFIKKACGFISLNVTDYIDVTHKGGIEHLSLQERFIDTFKKYMKGE